MMVALAKVSYFLGVALLPVSVTAFIGPLALRGGVINARSPAVAVVAVADKAEASKIEDTLLQLLPSTSKMEIDELAARLIDLGAIEEAPALSPLIEGDWTLVHTSSSSFDLRNPLGKRSDGTSPGLEGAISAISEFAAHP